ncbi:MAG: DUF937 domain-containing protein [Gammaproteobacteria bacterium]|nr:DUF937 domain-containing protein [Gammaproteobacteria bacterium]
MNLLDLILNDSNSQVVGQLAKRAGVSENEIGKILEQAVPAVSRGMKSKMTDENGLSSILDILKDKQPERYIEQPDILTDDKKVIDDGNSILGEIFGNKDTSREVASRVATKTGSSSGIVKMLLPIIASLAMGALSKKGNTGVTTAQANQSGGMIGMVKDFIDADDDGSIVDDLFTMAARRFF